ncbi:MAG TPA: glycosyltransferase [Candidatus Sulfopaludibacter sp.]|jgi:GT2 family glycosyltransferase/glycosyltransferase involved in cell wall biosynthesis|nr:glycosyltransferase [Candidatus Sulfopaludibacter sp.]
MSFLKRFLRALPLLLLSPFLIACSVFALALADLLPRRKRPAAKPRAARPQSASVVIPNWNGKDLLEKYLPSIVTALAGNPANEIVVVDNGSEDGSAEFVRARFPQVNLVALPQNLGFGGGSNAGFRAAKNDIVVLLNSDMRVAADFLAPLLAGFDDDAVFAVSCQIFFSDPAKKREETGLTQGWWQDGGLRVRHRLDDEVRDLFPCFYGGGGSCAFDRQKFLELGGFDELLAPFYLEDTDLGYMAWKRGWKVLYQPRSIVYHEHRGTIGKRFREEQIQAVLKKNYLLFCWKNIHEWRKLAAHFVFAWAGMLLAVLFGDLPLRPNLTALWRAFTQLPQAFRSRRLALSLAEVSDTEAFRRPMGGYFRDRFVPMDAAPPQLRVLFVSPYPICPPVHGGGVFMYQTLRQMTRLAEVHVLELLDWDWQQKDNEELRQFCASAEWLVRPSGNVRDMGSLLPHAVHEFANQDLDWLIHRQLYQKRIDVLQLEYTPLAQYHGDYRRIVCALFEHDVYFQSIGRGLGHMIGLTEEIKARVEYLRALRYELRALPRFDQVQVCTPANRDYLLSFRPELAPKLHAGLRAGIDTAQYDFRTEGREPFTMLFVGSFRHEPNRVAMEWFVRQVLPLVLQRHPNARLVVAGSDPPPAHTYADFSANLEMLGYVEDVRRPLSQYSVFVCPILSGSGVRVKLLEAFAAGIPVVSTVVGAEGLAQIDGQFCALSDDPAGFADRVSRLMEDRDAAAAMAQRARAEVEAHWDMAVITRKLVAGYAELVKWKRTTSSPGPS